MVYDHSQSRWLFTIQRGLHIPSTYCTHPMTPVPEQNSGQDGSAISVGLTCYVIKFIFFEAAKIRNALYEGWNFNSGKYLFTTDTK